MFGLTFHELGLIVLICLALLFLQAGVFYVMVFACGKLLKSELRVWIALCILSAVVYFTSTFGETELGATRAAATALAQAPFTVAADFAWLWAMGSICRLMGLRRLGTAWRDMATLHFQALRFPTRSEMT